MRPQLIMVQSMVTGKVTDTKGQPVIGVNVFIKDRYDGTSTHTDRSYSFTTSATGNQSEAAILLGYKKQANNRNTTGFTNKSG